METVTPRVIFRGAELLFGFGTPLAPRGYTLHVDPLVRCGVELSGDEAKDSIVRGGDGRVAVFEGGIVELIPESSGAMSRGRSLTFCLRARDPSGTWNAPLVTLSDTEGRPIFSLTATGSSLVLALFTNYREAPLTMEASLSLIGRADWHDFVARYSGARVELFVDGALADEEWPIGSIAGPAGARLLIGGTHTEAENRRFQGFMSHLALWDWPLSDVEVEALSDSSRRGAFRSPAFSVPINYGIASGGGNVGDCFPFFHDGNFHFYYLLDRRHHESKYGLGAHQWAHSSSRDLVRWEHHPLAVPVTDEREGSICTGSVFFHEGTWYAFYAERREDRSEHVCVAVGDDGITFTKAGQNPVASPSAPYKYGPFRDPFVFRDQKNGRFHMLVTAELECPAVAGRGGCLAHLVSSDLLHWEQEDPFLVTGYGDQPECSELFAWRGWYYLVFSHFGVARYRMARDPFGPWAKPRVDSLDGPLARVMKTAQFSGDRRIGAFFVAEGTYAGRAVFRELVQNSDGTLGSTWVPEMAPPEGPVSTLAFAALDPRASGSDGEVLIESPQGFSAAALTGLPRRFHLRFRVRIAGPVGTFGVGVRGTGNFRGAVCLEFEPARRRVGWRHPGKPSWLEEETAALYEVDSIDRDFTVEVIVLDDILDTCIDKRRTLIDQTVMNDGDALFFYCHESTASFEGITVRPLVS